MHPAGSIPRAKLSLVLQRVSSAFGKDIAYAQVWEPTVPQLPDGAIAPLRANGLALRPLGAPRTLERALDAFGAASAAACDAAAFSVAARAFCGGEVAVVQDLAALPPFMHPVARLAPAAAACVGGAVYVPVYLPGAAAPRAVLELLLHAHAADSLLLPNLVTRVSAELAAAALSACCLLPQPVGRSTLAGRRMRPAAASDDESCSGSGSDGDGDDGGDDVVSGGGDSSGSGDSGDQRHVAAGPQQGKYAADALLCTRQQQQQQQKLPPGATFAPFALATAPSLTDSADSALTAAIDAATSVGFAASARSSADYGSSSAGSPPPPPSSKRARLSLQGAPAAMPAAGTTAAAAAAAAALGGLRRTQSVSRGLREVATAAASGA